MCMRRQNPPKLEVVWNRRVCGSASWREHRYPGAAWGFELSTHPDCRKKCVRLHKVSQLVLAMHVLRFPSALSVLRSALGSPQKSHSSIYMSDALDSQVSSAHSVA
ncbi:hypothetical protein ABBQ38_013377 [Trebouxia sp. C0009 RCD-2024]